MKKLLPILVSTLFLSGCSAFARAPIGGIFTSVKTPGRFVTGETTNPGGSAISGESCAMGVLGAVAWGDFSIDAALKSAGAEGKTLKNVAVDHSIFSILGVYQKSCTTVNAHVAM